jgi:beta-galactosidase/beta-glucuronidase
MPLSDTAATGPASRAILTEPAFWTPDLPNLYRVEARLEPQAPRGDEAPVAGERE